MFSEVKIDDVLTLATYGYRSVDLGLGSHKKVVSVCLSCGSKVRREYRNAMGKHQCPSVVGNERRCYACKAWKDLSLFNKSCKNGKRAKICRQCFNNHPAVKRCEINRRARLKKEFEVDKLSYFNTRVVATKQRCKSKGWVCEIDAEFLLELWNRQDGLCAYSGLPMARSMKQLGFQCWDSPSIDRRNPDAGYTRENVVLCCFGVNSFKQCLSESQFIEQLKKINWWFDKK